LSVEFSFAGFDPNARRVHIGHAESFAQVRQSDLRNDAPFVLFIGSDASTASNNELNEAAALFLERGAVYVMTWGADCERIKQVFDDAIAAKSSDEVEPNLFTTAHPDESIVVALTFAANFAAPAEEFDVQSMLVVIVGSSELHQTARESLAELLEDEAPVAES
jgi:hypothetical protein